MLATIVLEIKVFLFIMSVFVVLIDLLHTVSVFRLRSGKMIPSTNALATFGVALAFIITMLICGF